MRNATVGKVKDTIRHFGQDMLNTVGSKDTFNINSKPTKEFLKEFAGARINGITKVTQERVAKIVSSGYEAGHSTAKIAKSLSDKFDQWSEGRAFVMAKTEVNAASNFGAWEGMAQANVEEKEWLSTQDDAVRETHEELDGTVVGIDEPFESSSGATAQYPGDFGDPAEDVNCRCGVLPVIGDKHLVGSRAAMFKALEAERKPWDKLLWKGFKQGFQAQKRAVLAALEAA